MVAYQEFLSLSRSSDSETRGQAAHLSAVAYLSHRGPADEHAALYAALIGFLEDPSVKVRAALAYGLLHSADAPRPIILALLQDSAVIARAVAQYSPVLLDADLIGRVKFFEISMLLALSQRAQVSTRLASALVARNDSMLTKRLLERADVAFDLEVLSALCLKHKDEAGMRGALLARKDLPASARLQLVESAVDALRGARLVKGALAPERLERLLRDTVDTAVTAIGEQEAHQSAPGYVASLIDSDKINTRVLLHAVVHGHVMFFADCLAVLAQAPREKVFSLLETGSRASLNALLARCGLGAAVRNLLSRLVFHARTSDLADDASARHYVVTALTEELIAEFDGVIPPELEDAFSYLSEQNILLARKAARGVMAAFAGETSLPLVIPAPMTSALMVLPAA